MHKYRTLLKQLFAFGLVGGTSFLIDLVVTTSLYNIFHLQPYLAAGLGFLSAFFFNFPMNRKHVFNHTQYDRFSMKGQVLFYLVLTLFNLFITGLIVQLLVSLSGVQIGIAKVIVTVLIATWNFFIFKYLIFSKIKPL